ncbi:MAG: hypothetical protein GC146_03275 [Limimaricola sp.]|uniref:hypothetical protein n=1 Tax=Limimaricola sp. TaxID=2211665 RepID=UPI001E0CC9F3|nr:hypothetical protein [Limimaricola sp.]MBI1416221.1 hypothetical protein [Limimaricola sp.]
MQLLANIVGAVGAIVYVGYFALSVGAPSLSIIVALSLAMMVYSFYDDMRTAASRAVRLADAKKD